MRDFDSDDYASVAGSDRLIPSGVRRMAGAAVFLGLVAALGLWSYRLGTRDAAEVPIIRAMEGPARLQPKDPGGVQAAHQGLEVNAVLAGHPAPVPRATIPAEPAPPALAAEDEAQGELILAAPARLVEETFGTGDDLPMPPQEIEAAPAFAPAAPEIPPRDEAIAEASEPTAADGPRPRGRPAGLVVARAAPPAPKAASEPAPDPASRSAPTAARPPSTAPAEQEVSGVSPGSRLVQLGAFDSEEVTRQAWSQLVARHGDLLSGKRLFVERTTANARVFYRLRVAGFANTDETGSLCAALRSRGVACIPVTLQ